MAPSSKVPPQKVLVLGGHGFLGANVSRELEAEGFAVSRRSRRNGLDISEEKPTCDYLRSLQPDFIVNCAADTGSLPEIQKRPSEILDNNVQMLLGLYRAIHASGTKPLIIHPIANCAFPFKIDLQTEANFWDGPVHDSVFAFAQSRRFLVALSDTYRTQRNIRSLNLLVPNMYGPEGGADFKKMHAMNALCARVVAAQASGRQEINVWGTGAPQREWLFVRDFSRLIVLCLRKKEIHSHNSPICLGKNEAISIKESMQIIKELGSFNGRILWDVTKPDGSPLKVMSEKSLKKFFPEFQHTPFREGIMETIHYYHDLFREPSKGRNKN